MEYVSKGLSSAEIARQMYLSESCIKTQIHNILTRLNVDNRLQAVLIFLQDYKGIKINDGNTSNRLTIIKQKDINGTFSVRFENHDLGLDDLKWFHQQLFERIKELELKQYINRQMKDKN